MSLVYCECVSDLRDVRWCAGSTEARRRANGCCPAGVRPLVRSGISTPSQWSVAVPGRRMELSELWRCCVCVAHVHIVIADGLVMSRWVMFRVIIRQVVTAFLPEVREVFLGFLILKPVISHVYCFGAALFQVFVDEINRRGVVQSYLCARLWIAHFCQGNAQWDGFFAVDKGCSNFRISCR